MRFVPAGLTGLTFGLLIAAGPSHAAPPPNDTCSGAVPIPLNTIVTGTTVEAVDDFQTPSTTACYSGLAGTQTPTTAPGRDVVFTFTAPSAGNYSIREVLQIPNGPLRTQNPVLYASSGCPGAGGTVSCLAGANRITTNGTATATGTNNNQSEELSCLALGIGETIYIVFDDGAVANLGGPLAVEVTPCVMEVEPNDSAATASTYGYCGENEGTATSAPTHHCVLGANAGLACQVTNSGPATNCGGAPGLCFADAVCEGGPNAGLSCVPKCVNGTTPGATCTASAQCSGGGTCQTNGGCGVCTAGTNTGQPCISSTNCGTGGVCAVGVCGRTTNEGDVDFWTLGTPAANSKIYAAVEAPAANDSDWRLRITSTTETLGFDDDDGTLRQGATAPTIAGAKTDGTQTYVKVSRTAAFVSEPYRLYAVVQPPIAAAQAEVGDAPDIIDSWPALGLGAPYLNNGANTGYITGTFTSAFDADCYKALAYEGDDLVWFGDSNPSRVAGGGVNSNPQVVLYDAEGAGISNFIFATGTSRNTGPFTGNAGFNATTPQVTSYFQHWRATYTGMFALCFYPFPAITAPFPKSYAGSLSTNCGPMLPAGPGTTTSDVGVTMTGPPGPVTAGGSVTYTITITNHGSQIAQEITIEDTIPAELSFVGVTIDDGLSPNGNTACTSIPTEPSGGFLQCTTMSLAPGASATFTLDLTLLSCVDNAITVDNTVSIESISTDPNAANDTASAGFQTVSPGSCSDQNACTVGDHCTAGACVPGTPLDCNDGNPCTVDSCDEVLGCIHTPLVNGTACSDGSVCTTGDACAAGVCTGAPISCDDGNPCTTDTCDAVDGCSNAGGTCVVAVDADEDATEVSVAANVTVTYHDPVQAFSINPASFRLIGPGESSIPASRALSPDGKSATLDPTAALAPDTTYRIETTTGVVGPGSRPAQAFTSWFRTGAEIASEPIGSESQPADPVPAGSGSGGAVAGCGDLNGDGLGDTCSGASGYSTTSALTRAVSVEAGAVLVYFGSSDAADRAAADIIFEGVDPHDRVGVSIAGDFDFNGDGHPDIVIGAEQVDRTDPENPVPTGNGKVYLIFFDPADTVHYPNIADPDVADVVSLALVGQPGGIPGVVFEGASFGDQAGFSVDGGGTSTPSSGRDVVIGAPGANPGGRTDAGAVYVVFDSPTLSGEVSLTRISSGLPDQIGGKEYQGATAGDALGYDTAFAGPTIDGASATTGSIIMSAPRASGGKGIVGAVSGDPDTTPIIVDAIGVGQPGFRIVGTQIDEGLGTAVDDGGDALADGTTDILIGAPGYDNGSDTDAGRVLQTSQLLASGVYLASDVGTTVDGVIWTGDAAGDALGTAVAGVGDVTGDGFDDIVLGAPLFDPIVGGVPQTDAGAVYVIAGTPVTGSLGTQSVSDVGTTVAGEVLTGTQAGEQAGSSVADIGDIDGDGEGDFAVGAPELDADAGTIYLVLESELPAPGACGPSGCTVADLTTGAEVLVPQGALSGTITVGAEGILTPGALPAPVPTGRMLFGAARFTPEGQTVTPPGTAYLPTGQTMTSLLAPSEVLPVSYFNGSAWVSAGVNATTGPNPSYPGTIALQFSAGTLHVFAVFLNDADGDQVRDETDNCPTVANASQLDTDGDQLGDACECLNPCSDGNPCTNDGCSTTTGCTFAPNTDACTDGNACTTGDTCSGGSCQPGSPIVCNDGNACSDDACNPPTGCVFTPNTSACNDGNACTTGDACAGGSCQPGSPVPAPAEITGLAAAADEVTVMWSSDPAATSYDVVRGTVAALAVGPGGDDETCFGGLASPSVVDAATPGSGTAFWYLARGVNACGAGSYGQQSDGTPRATATCP